MNEQLPISEQTMRAGEKRAKRVALIPEQFAHVGRKHRKRKDSHIGVTGSNYCKLTIKMSKEEMQLLEKVVEHAHKEMGLVKSPAEIMKALAIHAIKENLVPVTTEESKENGRDTEAMEVQAIAGSIGEPTRAADASDALLEQQKAGSSGETA